MLYWIFGLQCSKTIVIFVISALQLVELQSFVQKLEFLNLELIMPYLSVLARNFQKLLSFL